MWTRILQRNLSESRIFLRLTQSNSLGKAVRFRLRRILKRAGTMQMTVHGRDLAIRPASYDFEVAFDSLGAEFDALDHLFDRDSTGLILDAGGYIGTAALALAACYPKARIITLEPSRENFGLLLKNTNETPNIHPINAALVNEGGPEEVELIDPGKRQWGFTIVPTAGAVHQSAVPTVTLSALLDRFNADSFLIAKFDIEGAEGSFFAGDTGWLEKVGALFIELHEQLAQDVKANFLAASKDRIVIASGGEKWLSLRLPLRL